VLIYVHHSVALMVCLNWYCCPEQLGYSSAQVAKEYSAFCLDEFQHLYQPQVPEEVQRMDLKSVVIHCDEPVHLEQMGAHDLADELERKVVTLPARKKA
jgi:hypothetical protein